MLNREATKQLKSLMKYPFYAEAAMKLVRLGANPDSCDNQGYSLLHRIVIPNKDGRNDLYIEELVSVYNANIHIKGPLRLTPLEYLMGRPFYVEAAMKLVRLGANPDSCDNQGYSLLGSANK